MKRSIFLVCENYFFLIFCTHTLQYANHRQMRHLQWNAIGQAAKQHLYIRHGMDVSDVNLNFFYTLIHILEYQ